MKKRMRLTAGVLAVVMVGVSLPAFRAGAMEAQENTPKEEIVYISLKGDGTVKEVNVVNRFSLEGQEQVVDYGEYESLRNMTTMAPIRYEEGKISIEGEKGELYYEGKLINSEIPWDISIHYYMDGEEYSAEEIGGKSGQLRLTMCIDRNEAYEGNFFEGFALQATITLDTQICRDIHAEGATIANVGGDKQLTYTILPGKGADIEVTAEVENFEMEGIAINGIRLNMDIDFDEASMREKLDEIIDGVNELEDGAGKLNEGTETLHEGTGELAEQVELLHEGTGELAEGAAQLHEGLTSISANSETLLNGSWSAYEGLCKAAQEVLNARLAEFGHSSVTLTPENYNLVLNTLLQEMTGEAVYQQAYDTAYEQVCAQVAAQADTLYEGYIDSCADMIYLNYIQSRAAELYQQAAAQSIYEQLVMAGYPQEQAAAYLQTEEGLGMIAQTAAGLSDEKKQQIIDTAVAQLTEEQKRQIRQGALESLTEEQKTAIREGYITECMESEAVSAGIDTAVAAVREGAEEVTQLKEHLDDYGVFYQGLREYTEAVGQANSGAQALSSNMELLHDNTGNLQEAVTELDHGAGELLDGTEELLDGTGRFAEETADMDEKVSEEIDSMIRAALGKEEELTSFTSDKNINLERVQFVIRTDEIQRNNVQTEEIPQKEVLSFWQKLLRLFGLY